MQVLTTAACLVWIATWPRPALADRLAVLEFAGTEGVVTTDELAYLSDRVRGAALKTIDGEQWEVITRENMVVLLEMNTDDLATCVGECEVETGRLIGAHRVISGSLVRLGSTLRLTLKSFDTDTGRMLGFEEVRAPTLESLADGVPSAITALFGQPRAPGSTPGIGQVEVSTGSDTDLLAAARELERLRAEREAREERERELEEQLAAERQRVRTEAEEALRSEARSEWAALASLRQGGGPEAEQIVEMYVAKYSDATVTVDGESHPVTIAQLTEARDWLDGRATSSAEGRGKFIPKETPLERLEKFVQEHQIDMVTADSVRSLVKASAGLRSDLATALTEQQLTREGYAWELERERSRFSAAIRTLLGVDGAIVESYIFPR